MTRRTAERIVPIAGCAALVWALLLSNDAVLAGGEATADGQPVLKRIAHLGGRWSSIVASDRLLYVATGSTVTVVDAAIYDRPEIVAASASAGDLIECLAINEDYLYAGLGEAGLRVFRIDGPTVPVVVGGTTTAAPAQALLVQDSHLYVAGRSVVEAFDLSDPGKPRTRWSVRYLPQGDNVNALRYANGYLYVASDLGLIVIDIESSPAVPQVANAITDYGAIIGVGVWPRIVRPGRPG